MDGPVAIVYGAEWCADCHRVIEILKQHKISYRYCDIDRDPAAKHAMLEANEGRNRIPVIVWDNKVLEDPTNETLLAALSVKGRA